MQHRTHVSDAPTRRRLSDEGATQCCSRCVQGWRQVFRDCAAIRDFSVRCTQGARPLTRAAINPVVDLVWLLQNSKSQQLARKSTSAICAAFYRAIFNIITTPERILRSARTARGLAPYNLPQPAISLPFQKSAVCTIAMSVEPPEGKTACSCSHPFQLPSR
jgi:hypothetical protein